MQSLSREAAKQPRSQQLKFTTRPQGSQQGSRWTAAVEPRGSSHESESPIKAAVILNAGGLSRYGKRSTPEQAVAWLLFGDDSSQDAEPQ